MASEWSLGHRNYNRRYNFDRTRIQSNESSEFSGYYCGTQSEITDLSRVTFKIKSAYHSYQGFEYTL